MSRASSRVLAVACFGALMRDVGHVCWGCGAHKGHNESDISYVAEIVSLTPSSSKV